MTVQDLDKTGARVATESYDLNDLQRRWAMLFSRSYEEVVVVGQFVCRSDEALAARFATLSSIARSRPGSRKSDSGEPSPAPAAAT